MENKLNILITGAGSPGGPGIIKALIKSKNDFNIFICDCDENASGKYLLPEKFFKIPMASDEEFLGELLNFSRLNKIKVILPLVTLELFKLSKNKKIFSNYGIKVIVSDFNSLEILNDKGLLYMHLNSNDIRTPTFRLAKNKNELIKAIYELGYPYKKVVMKPRVSNGSRGVRIIDHKIDSLELLFNQKPGSLFTNLDNLLSNIKNSSLPPLVLSEFLPGKELTVDTIIRNGKLSEHLIRTRDQIRAGISTKGKFINNKKVTSYIKKIIKTFEGLEGPVGFQLKESSEGEYLLLECNPRIQGSSTSAIGLNINIPLIVINNALDRKTNFIKKNKDISFSRYYENIFYEL